MNISSRVKVLIVTNIPAPYRVDFFKHLQKSYCEYDFHFLFGAENEDNRKWSVDTTLLNNIHFLNTKIIAIRKGFDTKYIHVPTKLFRVLNSISPDIVICWEYNPVSVQVMLWCKHNKKKYINLTDGTIYSERNIGLIQKATRKYIISHCDAAIASSTKAKEKLFAWGIAKEKVFLSLLTINIEPFLSIDRCPVSGRILYVGSMIERKGLDLLISALKHVKSKYELRIVGNGTQDEIARIKEQIKQANLSGTVTFCGFKEGVELLDEYKKAKLFVFPSREDCFGLVLVEAFAARVPIITSKYADGAYDVINNNQNGIIIDPYNEQVFGEVIQRQLTKGEIPFLDRAMIKKFSFEEVSKGYIEAINFVYRT